MLVVEQCGVVEVGAFDVRRRPVGDRHQLLDARPRAPSLDPVQPFAQGLGDDAVIVSPVARAIRCASRWASGSLMFRLIWPRSFSSCAILSTFLYRLARLVYASAGMLARARGRRASALDPRPASLINSAPVS